MFWLSGGCQVDILAPDKLLFVFDLPSRAIVGRGYGSDFRCADWCFVSTSYQQLHFSVPVVMKTVKLLSCNLLQQSCANVHPFLDFAQPLEVVDSNNRTQTVC